MPFFAKATLSLPYADGADDERRQLEDKHAKLIYTALRKLMRLVVPADTTVANITPDIAVQRYRDNQHILRDALVAMLTDGAMLGADVGKAQTEAAMGVGVRKASPVITGVDWDLINDDVLQWVMGGGLGGSSFGQGYADTLATAMAGTSERGLRTLVGEWVRNDLSYRQLVTDLERSLFSRSRSEMLVQTEITRSFAEGNRAAWIRGGIITQMQWFTAGSELTCPICRQMNGQIADVRGSFGSGLFPPAHPRCRCFLQGYVPDIAVQPLSQQGGGTAEQARRTLVEIDQSTTEQSTLLKSQLDQRRRDMESLYNKLSTNRDDVDLRNRINAAVNEIDVLDKQWRALETQRLTKLRQSLYVDKPIELDVQWASKITGDRRKQIVDGLDEFRKLVSVPLDNNKISVKAGGAGRSSYSPGKNTINMTKGSATRVTVHEMGHWLEDASASVHRKALEFLDRRTEGESAQSLRSLTGINYDRREKAKPDKFLDAYMGKEYIYNGNRYATEVVSMGIEYMYKDPLKLATQDADMFDFIFNLLRGN